MASVDDLFSNEADALVAERPKTKRPRYASSPASHPSGLTNGFRSQGRLSAPADDGQFNFSYVPDQIDQQSSTRPRTANVDNGSSFDLGLDKEVQLEEKPARKPLARLDDERLIDNNVGLPHLRRQWGPKVVAHCRRHLARPAIRAAGAERLGSDDFADLARLLEEYQMWMHSMFPKAKFRDCIKMVRQVGRSGRTRTCRRGMIDALLPQKLADEGHSPKDQKPDPAVPAVPVRMAQTDEDTIANAGDDDDDDDDDDFADLCAQGSTATHAKTDDAVDVDEDDEDALEALGWD
ncbi:chromosome segregation in meiosis-related protein [Savitreella phatthalungensis]